MRFPRLLALLCVALATGCRSAQTPVADADKPQLTPDVRVMDETIHSSVLSRDVAVRLIVPAAPGTAAPLPVVYLLHGAGVSYHDWTNNSQIASLAAKGIVLVLPNMQGSYYINQLDGSNNRYEDFFMDELLSAVHGYVPYAATDRAHTAIVGISRGGYGAAVLGLKHPEVFGFIGLLSPALDFAERGFRVRTPFESMQFRKVFGPLGSATRMENNPYLLIEKFTPNSAPFIFIGCGREESLASVTLRFLQILEAKKLPHEWSPWTGKHNWDTWNEMIPWLETSLQKQFGMSDVTRSVQ